EREHPARHRQTLPAPGPRRAGAAAWRCETQGRHGRHRGTGRGAWPARLSRIFRTRGRSHRTDDGAGRLPCAPRCRTDRRQHAGRRVSGAHGRPGPLQRPGRLGAGTAGDVLRERVRALAAGTGKLQRQRPL
ncbi:MAG: hypothetical protein AVDCRST_MAG71-2188, partial [uncultured Lysobacter sp.]